MILTYFDHIKRLRHSMRHHEYPWMVWMCGGHIRWTKPSSKMGWSSHGIWDLPMQPEVDEVPFFEFGQNPLICWVSIPVLVVKSPFWWLQIVRTLLYSRPFQARFGCFKSLATMTPFLLLYLLSLLVNGPFFCWQTFSNFRPAFHSLPPKRAVGL